MVDQKQEDIEYLRLQENLYWGSTLTRHVWYREIFGGEWRLIKLGEDTPYTFQFCVWTKMPDSCWEGYKEILAVETYKHTGVDTRLKFIERMILNFFKKYLG